MSQFGGAFHTLCLRSGMKLKLRLTNLDRLGRAKGLAEVGRGPRPRGWPRKPQNVVISSSHGSPSDFPVYDSPPSPIPPQVEREPKEFLSDMKNRSGNPSCGISGRLKERNHDARQVKGEIISGAPTAVPIRIPFLESKHTLWLVAEGYPLVPAPKTPTNRLQSSKKTLPGTVEKKEETFLLPHAFIDRLASFSVRYTAELCTVRRKLLRTDDKTVLRQVRDCTKQDGPNVRQYSDDSRFVLEGTNSKLSSG
ncbi:hypothetical protein B0H13DRAFT_1902955 [Mycena leptocephala]|nr:hypothetical protein B0H13DRAFT_1902955 [Mycena leptocephala]